MLKVFNCRVKYTNRPGDSEKFLAVSNHMGFVDILMLASCFPVVFVTSNEMKETPFLGLLTEMAGCMYVERRSRTKILEEMKSIGAVLKRGYRVVLYPEATSTNGEKVLPFKKTLIMAAAYAGVPIQPIVINFRKINDEEFSLKWRDHVCWYGDIPFVTAMWKSLTLKSVDAEVEFLEKIFCTTEDDRGLIADKAHALISAKFVPVKGAPQEDSAAIEFETEST
ncbi:lysophospholipid acyltransferase family protein [Bdellovibrio reynosensis]|uniref:1-acyl-sn-glycerol-3-phosphate acyltransferase n=1 Tax=Bdellovibrio reynosensis TaxID=2835041 RepID=A0ABY4C545_9BACT|nr:lysophospholipid acyltransferase family protein [Bdellovibrio reynosensis]UOF00087.1 1-acyl-sn-glycerol-3-phosphate acyltransferase [Bdellovibrio reynosensis]